MRERLATHPAFGPLIRDTPRGPRWRARHPRAACARRWSTGGWEAYWENTARAGGGLRERGDPARLVGRAREPVPRRHDRARVRRRPSPSELLEDVHALNRWLDDAIAAFAQAFVSANEQVIASQQAAIRQLSTPVLQLRSGLLILPIVGALDRERLDQMRALLLRGGPRAPRPRGRARRHRRAGDRLRGGQPADRRRSTARA